MCGWYFDMEELIEENEKEELNMKTQTKIKVLKEEISILKSRIEPHDTGHLYTTIDTLKWRVKELKGQLGEGEDLG
jgi:hypothetical protein